MTNSDKSILITLTIAILSIMGVAVLMAYIVSLLLQELNTCEVEAPVSDNTYFMGAAPPPSCDHLYDTGEHEDWAACMGVPYR